MLALKEFRQKAGLTQRYVAYRLGISVQAVSKYENGLSTPSVRGIQELAELYGCSEIDIISRELKCLRDKIHRIEDLCDRVARLQEARCR